MQTAAWRLAGACAVGLAMLLGVPAAAVTPADAPASRPGRSASAKPAAPARRPPPANPDEARERVREATRGMASWYGAAFQGKPTASGEPFDPQEFTAAHPTLPFGTVVEVRSLTNGRKVRVRINDRGPHTGNRIIDLSEAAARQLGLQGRGIKRVEVKVIGTTASEGRDASGIASGAAAPASAAPDR